MSEELQKAITEILQSDKTPEEKATAIQNLMNSYSTTNVERYTTKYVSAWKLLASAFALGEAELSETSAAAIVKAFAELKEERDSKAAGFSALEAKVSELTLKAAASVSTATTQATPATSSGAANGIDYKAQYETLLFETNERTKKHIAAGWDQDTAQIMFTYSRAKYDEKMKATPAPAFNATPIVTVQTQQDFIAPNQPLTQALAMFTQEYITEKTKAGRAMSKELMEEAMDYADKKFAAGLNQASQSVLN
jgi:hypothetical protein